jgi:DNA helicase-2/ATP-dependent DNA helicase PcrA
MDSRDPRWREEQARVDRVTGSIRRTIGRLEEEIGAVRSEAFEIRKHFWDEVTVNFSTFDDIQETYFSMKQQADLLAERERTERHSAEYVNRLKRLADSPYFGRIDFREAGADKAESIYLGIASYREEDSDEFLVYDWRAPVSSLYYDYPPGPAEYETPSGSVSGELELKRQFVIRGGEIRCLFDTGVTIGDELLQQVLSRTSDSAMRSIVATIQREQNRIIRNDRSRMLIVQGAAGSGKTSAALQRVAYLLYRYRGTLSSDQMVLFSPNPMFNSYVSSVLPELGEANMIQTTFQDYLELRLGRQFRVEDAYDQLEYVLTREGDAEYGTRMAAIRFKSSSAYLALIQTYIRSLEASGMLFRPVKFRGRTIVSADAIAAKFYGLDPSIRLANRIELVRDWLLGQVKAFAQTQKSEAWVDEEMQYMNRTDYQRAYAKLRAKRRHIARATFDDAEAERDLLAEAIVSAALKPVRDRVRALRFVDAKGIYRRLHADPELAASIAKETKLPGEWQAIAELTVRAIDEGRLPYEDATPYLYLNERLKGFRVNTNVRHVLVDEVQDYTPFQLEFLKWLFPRARMTALGDLNQSIHARESVLEEGDPLTNLYGPEETEWIRLTRSYRSTREIVEFTRAMIPGGDEIEPFNRSGEKPSVLVARDRDTLHRRIVESLERLMREGYESAAVICRTAAESEEAHRALSEKLPVRLVKKDTPQFEKGICVIPAYLAKGVEFDAVLIYNASDEVYARESERRLFYTACTRAMHALQVFVLGRPCRFLEDAPAETYRMEQFV